MHSPAVYLISAVLFILSGLLLFAAGSSWMKVQRMGDEQPISRASFRAAAGLTAAALVLLGAAVVWAAMIAFIIHV